jgi:hypothetical protein
LKPKLKIKNKKEKKKKKEELEVLFPPLISMGWDCG